MSYRDFILNASLEKKKKFPPQYPEILAIFSRVCLKKSVFRNCLLHNRNVCVYLNSGEKVWLNASRVWRQINAIIFPSPSSAKRNQPCHALVVYVAEAWASGRRLALILRDCGLLKTKFLKTVIYSSAHLLNLAHGTSDWLLAFVTWDG